MSVGTPPVDLAYDHERSRDGRHTGRGLMTRRHALTAAITMMTSACLVITGCIKSDETYQQEKRDRIEAAPLRTDLEPIASRWPQLGDIQQAHWVGGILTDERVPGPNTHFIEAVVVLTPAEMTRLTDQYQYAPGPPPPDPPASLLPYLPEGTWLNDEEADQAFSSNDLTTGVFLHPEDAIVYISARTS